MVIMDIRIDNFYQFKNFHMNMSYPKKIVDSTIEAEHLADSIRLLSAGEDPTTWAEEVAVHAATLAQVTASLTALRKVAHDSEILMEREEKA